LYTEIFDSAEQMDIEVVKLATTLSNSNPEAMEGLKKVMWQGTDHWDTLLMERAVSSGTLVLSDFTRNAINKFKTK
jgi:methylglutaconyl-CoA hydratase